MLLPTHTRTGLSTIRLGMILASFSIFPAYLGAQVSCTQVSGLSATIAEAPNSFNTSGKVVLTYTWTATSSASTASAAVPANATVTNVAIFAGPKETNDITLSTACIQHGTSGWPVDFLASPGGLAAFNGTSVAGAGPWIMRPVVTSFRATSVLQLQVNIQWRTPAPAPPPPLTISCTEAAGPSRVGTPYSATCYAYGGASPFTWSLGGTIPRGLTLTRNNANTATISGVPTSSGEYNYVVEVSDRSQHAQRDYSGVIPPSGIGGYDLQSQYDHAFAFDYDGSGKLDHLVLYRPGTGTMWILKNDNGQFGHVYAMGDPGTGIGGYDLSSTADRAFAFDYDGSGKLDHLVLYRPGTGTMWILKNVNGQFSPVYAMGDPGSGIGGYDLSSPADRAFAFDYDGSGKLDHLVLYRPGTGTMWILKNVNGKFSPVYAAGDPGNGIGGYDLKSTADRAFAFDYDGSGKLDHLALYRPGTGTIWILKNVNGQFSPVYAMGDPGSGIGGYDLSSPADRAFAFDYNESGKLDHLVLYRPGTGTMWILKNVNGQFSPVYAMGDPGSGIGGYDLSSPADRAFPFDYDGSGRRDHLVLYRPGTGIIWILRNSAGAFSPVYVPR